MQVYFRITALGNFCISVYFPIYKYGDICNIHIFSTFLIYICNIHSHIYKFVSNITTLCVTVAIETRRNDIIWH